MEFSGQPYPALVEKGFALLKTCHLLGPSQMPFGAHICTLASTAGWNRDKFPSHLSLTEHAVHKRV